jgi:hypothetical protein
LSPQHVNNVLKRPLKGGNQGRAGAPARDERTTKVVSLVKAKDVRKPKLKERE